MLQLYGPWLHVSAALRPKHVTKDHKVVALNIVSFINVVYDVKIYMLIMTHNGMASIQPFLCFYCFVKKWYDNSWQSVVEIA